MAHNGKSLISVFQELFASIVKISLWEGEWTLAYYSLKFRHFPDIF